MSRTKTTRIARRLPTGGPARLARPARPLAGVVLLGVALLAVATPAFGLRANLRTDLDRLEQMGHYEEALFFRRSTMDMILAVHVAWSGAPYDPAMDAVFFETRTDRRYWNLVNGQKRAVTDLLAKAKLSAEQLDRLDDRVRVYVEDHLSPEFDEMGNFYFARKAWVMERNGFFLDASFRRRLVGYYCLRVCEPYYATMARELESKGRKAQAAAYQAKADHFAQEAERQFRRSNGDRLISLAQGDNARQQLPRPKVVELLKAQLKADHADVRFAAAMALADLDRLDDLLAAANDGDVLIRRQLARLFAEARHARGLEAMAADADAEVRQILQSAGRPPAGDFKPGIRARYFADPDRPAVADKVLPAVDIGFRGNERFPDKLRAMWDKNELVPAGATGQFLVRFEGKVLIPRDGRYHFYVKQDGANRATVRVGGAVAVSPRNDKQLTYSLQTDAAGQTLTRVDFSSLLDLKAGLVDLLIDYQGAQVRGKHGPAGLRLYWSGDEFVMEPVPAGAFFCGP